MKRDHPTAPIRAPVRPRPVEKVDNAALYRLLVRIETRLVNLMLHCGLDADGKAQKK